MNKTPLFIAQKRNIFFIVVLVLIQLGFFSNFWKVADQNWFDDFQRGSESLVIGRLSASEREGVFFKAGLMGRYYVNDDWKNQYPFYYDPTMAVEKESFKTYDSQIAGQAFTFALLDSVSPFSKKANSAFFKFLSSLIFSIILAFFLLWVYKNFGVYAAILTLILFLFSHWLTVFGRNLYWVVGILYIPFIVMLFKLSAESDKNRLVIRPKKIIITSFVLVLIKCFFTGFELITTVLIMFVVPFVFYAFKDKWTLKTFFSRIVGTALGSLAAIIVYFFTLAFQLSFIKGSFFKGLEYILYSFRKRTSGTGDDIPTLYTQSLESTIPMVLEKYWNGIAIEFNTFIKTPWESFFRIDFGELILIFLIFSLLTQVSKNFSPSTFANRNLNKALVLTTWASILAPLSWFIIFKGHSFIHTHTNFIVFYMPFCLFGFATIGSTTASISKDYVARYKIQRTLYKRVVQFFIIVLALAFIQKQITIVIKHNEFQEIRNVQNLLVEKNGFKVYRYQKKLWFIKENANTADFKTKFFLHLFPANIQDLPESRKQYGFDNLDFYYNDNSFSPAWWYGNDNFLIASIELPKYKLSEIRTGQYRNRKIIWDAKTKLKK